ncbi:hypothetical protein [Scytonema sp. NUACC26]|uniref:hypothetical protein n=1 Tax=Scytonema sp. NUACC26 TaxID=3140176 RepID=UPI0034DC1F07
MYTEEALSVLSDVEQYLTAYPFQYDWFWSCSDNLGTVLQFITRHSSVGLNRVLWMENTNYVQYEWLKILRDYDDNNIGTPLVTYLDILHNIFTREQVETIVRVYDRDYPYEAFMELLHAILTNNVEEVEEQYEMEVAA